MKLIEVKDKTTAKAFLKLPVQLYKDVPEWIRPLDKDIEEVFDPKKNKLFRNGECTRWILQDDKGKTIGRVAAFINRKNMKSKNSKGQELRVGGMGFFECINDENAAFKLFDQCKHWLQEHDINTIEGPINFGERDKWWGLLAEGFDREPTYCMPYTHPYYMPFFEAYGFKEYFRQLTFYRPVYEPLNPKYEEKANRVARDPKYSFETLQMNQLEKFAEDFRTIYNKAWVRHAGVAKMSSLQAKSIMKQMKPVIDPNIVSFGYYDGEPIAFFIILPELNQVFKKVNGKLNLWGKLIFIADKLLHLNKKMFGVAFGVVPEHQGKGVEGAMIMETKDIVDNRINGRYLDFEMNWIGDFNPKMVKLASEIGRVSKVHITYRKLLDDDLVFERCPDIN